MSDTIVELVARAGATDPDGPALIFEDGLTVSRGELLARAERFAGYLREVVRPGEMVAAMMANRTEFMVAWFATAAVGGVFVALNPEAGDHDLTHVLTDSGAVAFVGDEAAIERLGQLTSEPPALRERITVADGEPGGLDACAGAEPLRFAGLGLDPSAITNVYYTSGTTGAPKGCMVDHRYWRRLVNGYRDERGLEAGDRILCCLKFFYNDPSWQLLTSLEAGVGLVVMRRFSVSRFWSVVVDNDVTQLFTIGSIPALLLSARPSELERAHRVRYGIQVAIDAALHREMTDRWGMPWTDTYGLTETGGLIATPLADAERMTGSGIMGKARTDVETRLLAEDGSEVGAGVPGELFVRAPFIMSGYLNRPEATAEAVDPDGWFRTGDLMQVDDDGWFTFLGRKKDIVRRAGENISAGEVEEVLRSHAAVIDAAVVPVADALRGEEVLAHVYVTPEAAAGDDLDALRTALVEHAAERLAKHKVPRYLLLRAEDFPRTPSMRVAKQQLPRGEVPADAWDREAASAGSAR
jgi:crotonobetaine/carnitine-CoA ligase